jgi:hypothetical protein
MVQAAGFLVLTWMNDLLRLARRQRGQGIMEYSILLGAIALIAALALYTADFDFGNMTGQIQDCINFDPDCG